ncbi:uncharacterized protein J3R85_016008 [Psidium guajava]|nr:uncharacterized protein J3R85_016008 [Psidium guajava]
MSIVLQYQLNKYGKIGPWRPPQRNPLSKDKDWGEATPKTKNQQEKATGLTGNADSSTCYSTAKLENQVCNAGHKKAQDRDPNKGPGRHQEATLGGKNQLNPALGRPEIAKTRSRN